MIIDDIINSLTKYDWSDMLSVSQLESQVSSTHGYDLLRVDINVYEDAVVEELGNHLSYDGYHRGSTNQHETIDLFSRQISFL